MDFSKVRRGQAAMEESAQQEAERGSSNFKPFAPTITWSEDGEAHYVALLTDVDNLIKVLEHRFVPIGTYEKEVDGKKVTKDSYGFYISRKDPIIGEEHDPLEDDLDRSPSERYLIPAVELDVTFEEGRGGRKKPTAFSVLTDTYNRRIDPNDEDSETEEVTYPVLGIVDQAWNNFVTFLNSHAETDGPIQDLAFRVKRIGKKKETTYEFKDYPDQEIDYSPLFEHLDGISYLSDSDEFGELVEKVGKIAEEDGDAAAALVVGDALIHERLEELCDGEKYLADVDGLTPDDVVSKFDKGKKDGGGSSKKASEKKDSSKGSSRGSGSKTSKGGANRNKFEEVKRRAAERRAEREKAEAAKD